MQEIDNNELKQMVFDIHRALIGDKYRKDGIIHKVEDHEKRISRIERYVVAATAIGGFVFAAVKIGQQIMDLVK